MQDSFFTSLVVSGDLEHVYPYNGYNVECHGTRHNSTAVDFEQPIAHLSERQVYQLVRDIRRARRLFRAAQRADRS